MKTVVVVQRIGEFGDQLVDWLREAGYRVRTCGGPAPPLFDCLSYHYYDCPLWTQADLLLYDPWVQTGPNSYGSGGLLAVEHIHHPDVPILIWGSGGALPTDIAAMADRGEAEILGAELSRTELITTVERLIGRPDGESRLRRERIGAGRA
jgi:hypothetical protein